MSLYVVVATKDNKQVKARYLGKGQLHSDLMNATHYTSPSAANRAKETIEGQGYMEWEFNVKPLKDFMP
jgi:hypothetical protein